MMKVKMRKGITPVIAIIVLLLITVALAGMAWSYLIAYWQGLTGKSVDVTDSFCINADTAVVFIRNAGTTALKPEDEISIMNVTSATEETVTWTDAKGAALPGDELKPGKIARFTADCDTGELCTYRVVTQGGRAMPVSVQC